MRRRPKHTFPKKRTVPMLFAIGAVLSVLPILWPQIRAFVFVGIGASAAMVVFAVFLTVADFFRSEQEPDPSDYDRERDRFLSDVAHELKTPLTVVRGTAEALSDGAVPPDQIPEYYHRILRETQAMGVLVSDLLDVSRLRSGRVRFEPRDTDISFLLQSLCESLSSVADQKGVVLSCEIQPQLPVLLLDYDRIRQMIVIFADNAIKHTPQGGQVVLFVRREGETLCLGARDTGPGIAPEDLPYVFDRFYKADPSRGGLSVGSGIGLSIARQIAFLHGGTVEVESKLGEGTCFTAKVPFRVCEEPV